MPSLVFLETTKYEDGHVDSQHSGKRKEKRKEKKINKIFQGGKGEKMSNLTDYNQSNSLHLKEI